MKILVFTTVYPNSKQRNLGIFVHERMRRVADLCMVKVVAPVPYFPFAGYIKAKYRFRPSRTECYDGMNVHHPRFFLIPGYLKFLDGFFLFLSSFWHIRKLRRAYDFDIIDAHFAYPDGFAAVLLGYFFKTPVTITLRGTINRMILIRSHRSLIAFALHRANKIFSVSRYLVDLAKKYVNNIHENKISIIPNGVNLEKFNRLEKRSCRKDLGIPMDSLVLISVGGLVERKGHHRVLQILPTLIKRFPDILYVVAGGGGVEGDMTIELHNMVRNLELNDHVLFTGEISQEKLSHYLSASDVFVLPTRLEGWPNVFFEAMACGLPIVSTTVCGNREIVKDHENGFLVPFGDQIALTEAVANALEKQWDRNEIVDYARSRPWEKVAKEVYQEFLKIHEK
jgi:teichuronic acid biosynthesis glycosyltransferase TuaC